MKYNQSNFYLSSFVFSAKEINSLVDGLELAKNDDSSKRLLWGSILVRFLSMARSFYKYVFTYWSRIDNWPIRDK